MPITIQEIIASDTISQLVDKTNFNFDQLLLNGGGPAGPIGPPGPTGPAGGRGPKGTTWYEDTSSTLPGNLPTVVPPTATPRQSDYYLQLNGQVWEYTGLTWSPTTINLTGPTGPAGASGGFGLFFGSPSIGQETALYNGPVGEGNGATGGPGGNEGVPSIMIGGAVTTTNPLGTIGLTDAYIIPNTVAEGLISTYASLMIHQKDSTARSIVFHGGNAAGNTDKYYQGDIFGLSSISIGVDDKLVFDVPRQPTTPINISQLVGFEVNIPKRSQQYTAGKAITFQTGIEGDSYFAGENSDFQINVGDGSSLAGNKFGVTTSGTAGAAIMELGTGFVDVVQNTSHQGTFQLQSGTSRITTYTGKPIQLLSGGPVLISTVSSSNPSGSITNATGTGGFAINSAAGDINIRQTDSSTSTLANIDIANNANPPHANNGGDIYIRSNSQTILKKANILSSATSNSSIVLDYTATDGEHTRFVGRQTWSALGQSGLTAPPSPISILHSTDGALTGGGNTLLQVGSQGSTDISPGATFARWIGGTQSVPGLPAGRIEVKLGNEGPVSPATQPQYAGYDNTLKILSGSTDGAEEYFTASKNKIAFSAPWILKRDTATNSTLNSDPTANMSVSNGTPAPMYYGYNTARPPGGFAIPASDIGMPFTSQLTTPYISLNYGYGIGYSDSTNSPSPNNPGYANKFNFPIGLYPGQKMFIKIYVQSAKFTESGPSLPGMPPSNITYSNYGSINIRFPMFRNKIPYNTGTWSGWWDPASTSPNFNTIAAYTSVTVSTSSADASAGIGRWKMVECIWDGQIVRLQGANSNIAPGSPNGLLTYQQMGWTVTESTEGQTTAHGTPSTGTCFIAGTKVIMSDRSIRNIEDINIGDKVLGQNGINTVMAYDRPLLGLRLLYSINGGKSFVTSEHPFMTNSGWKSIDPQALISENKELAESLNITQLNIGDEILTDDGFVTIESINGSDGHNENQTLYNFRLDGDQTYYADGYLTHNK